MAGSAGNKANLSLSFSCVEAELDNYSLSYNSIFSIFSAFERVPFTTFFLFPSFSPPEFFCPFVLSQVLL